MSSARFLFAAVLISAFVTPFLASSINVAIPAMSGEFQVAPTFLSWAVTAFLLGSACMLLPFGRLADIVGRKRLFHTGTVCLILTTIGAGLVPNVGSLFLFRFLQGISTAMIFSTGTALLVASCKPEEPPALFSGGTHIPFSHRHRTPDCRHRIRLFLFSQRKRHHGLGFAERAQHCRIRHVHHTNFWTIHQHGIGHASLAKLCSA